MERTQQNAHMRVVIARLDAPAPGVAMIGTYGAAEQVQASVSVYFYGDEGESAGAGSEARWRTYLEDAFVKQTS